MLYAAFRSFGYEEAEIDYIDTFALEESIDIEADDQEAAKDELLELLRGRGFIAKITENRNEVIVVLPTGLEVSFYGFSETERM